MKKMSFLGCIVASLLLQSCGWSPSGESAETPAADTTATVDTTTAGAEVAEYKAFLGTLEQTIASGSKALSKFQDLFSGSLAGSSQADSSFALFYDFHRKLTFKASETMYGGKSDLEDYDFSKDKLYNPANLAKNGMRIEYAEGAPLIYPDYAILKTTAAPLVSASVQDYIAVLITDNKTVPTDDMGIVIDPKTFIDNTVAWDKLIAKYPNHVMCESMEDSYRMYFTNLVFGLDNTPLKEDGKLSASFFEPAYKYLAKAYPASETNKLIAPYYALCKKGDWKKAEAMRLQFVKNDKAFDMGDGTGN